VNINSKNKEQEMADQTQRQTSTQAAAEAIVRQINGNVRNTTTANQATVARAAENPPAQPWNRTLPTPANGGKK
jgi:hypothetical protein